MLGIFSSILASSQARSEEPSDDLTFGGITFPIDSISFSENDDGSYTGTGSSEITFSSQTITITIGADDGLVVEYVDDAWSLVSLDASVSTSFTLYDIDVTVDEDNPLTFLYATDGEQFELYGDITVSVEGNDVTAFLGDYDSPGFVFSDSALVSFDIGISDSIMLADLTVATTGDYLGISYDESSDIFEVYGGISVTFDDETLSISVGDADSPGLILLANSSNHFELDSLDATVSGDFTLYSIDITVDEDNPLTFLYDADGDQFEMYGDVTVGVEGNDVDAFLGDSDSPGLVLSGGSLVSFDIGISDSITLADLTVATTGDYLGISYDESSDIFEVYGGLSVTFDDQTLSVSVGDSSDPGLVLESNSYNHFELTSMDATVSADFTLYDLEVSLGDDGVTFVYDSDDDLYEVYGDIELSIDDQSLDALLGDSDDPGLEISGGVVTNLNISISTDLKIGGFEFIIPDDDPLDVTYSSDDDTYSISGEVELDSLWDVSVTLGDSDNPGIEIVDNDWSVDALSIEVDNIDLGFAQLQSVSVSFSDSGGDIDVDIDLDVYISEIGGALDAEVDVDDGQISEIYIDYTASGDSEGIEIADTGIDIAEISVTLNNIDFPEMLSMSGTIGLEFGGQLEIDSTTVTLAYIYGSVSIDSNGFTLSDTVYIGAYEDGDDWKALICDETVAIDASWAAGIYFMSGTLKLPDDYGIEIEEVLFFSDEYIVMSAKAKVRVPSDISIIGGMNLGSIDCDLLIDMEDSDQSFAAGWTSINFIVYTLKAGIKYKFHDGNISYIDSGDISDIEDEVSDIESLAVSALFVEDGSLVALSDTVDYTQKNYTFTIPEDAVAFLLELDWGIYDDTDTDYSDPTEVGEMLVEITADVTDGDSTETVTLTIHEMMNSDGIVTVNTDSTNLGTGGALTVSDSLGGLFASEGYMTTSDGSDLLPLAGGTATITLSYPSSYDTDTQSVVLTNKHARTYYDYEEPYVTIDSLTLDSSNSTTSDSDTYLISGATLPINLTYFTEEAFVDDTTISIFVDTDAEGYDGTPIKTYLEYGSAEGSDPVSETIDWVIENIGEDPSDTYYIYAQINNQSQQITYSDYSGPYYISPAVYGNVYDSDKGTVLEGFRVYIDTNGDDDYDAGIDQAALTNSNGNYVFDNVAEGEITVGVVVPYGYVANGNVDYVKTTYVSGGSVEVDFDITLLDSISGYVFEDTNGDGIFDDDESGISGVTLYLDENGNGSYDKGTDLEVVTNNDGFWRFYNVTVDSSYTIYVLAYPSQITTSEESSIVVETDSETIPDGSTYGDFSGNDIGIDSDSTDDVSDQNYMAYMLQYYPDGDSPNGSSGSDPDDDGLTNKIEQLLNTHPLVANASPTPVVTSGVTGGDGESDTVLVGFDQVSSYKYKVLASSDLKTWESIDSFRATSTETVILEVMTDLDAEKIFIIIEVED